MHISIPNFGSHGKLMIRSTIILTCSGFISRLIGFFFRIFMARVFHEEGMGLLQLSFPLLMLSLALCSGGIQAAITRYVAASDSSKEQVAYLCVGLLPSVSLSLLCCYLLSHYAAFLSVTVLHDTRCLPLLRVQALSIPFAVVHSCFCGYFYGMQKASIPAYAQILEQLARVGSVYVFVTIAMQNGLNVTLTLAALGTFVGECASSIFSVSAFCFLQRKHILKSSGFGSKSLLSNHPTLTTPLKLKFKLLLHHALPLNLHRILVTLLSSFETIQIPNRLILHGLTVTQSLTLYGTLTGMAIPLILFPSALTNSASVVLLPAIAKAQAQHSSQRIRQYIIWSGLFGLFLGSAFGLFFLSFGKQIGILLFHSTQAGIFIHSFGYICPFLYLPSMFTSVLNGLGKTGFTLLFHTLSILIRLFFVFVAIPLYGINGYLYGFFLSQIVLLLLIFLALRHFIVYNEACAD